MCKSSIFSVNTAVKMTNGLKAMLFDIGYYFGINYRTISLWRRSGLNRNVQHYQTIRQTLRISVVWYVRGELEWWFIHSFNLLGVYYETECSSSTIGKASGSKSLPFCHGSSNPIHVVPIEISNPSIFKLFGNLHAVDKTLYSNRRDMVDIDQCNNLLHLLPKIRKVQWRHNRQMMWHCNNKNGIHSDDSKGMYLFQYYTGIATTKNWQGLQRHHKNYFITIKTNDNGALSIFIVFN